MQAHDAGKYMSEAFSIIVCSVTRLPKESTTHSLFFYMNLIQVSDSIARVRRRSRDLSPIVQKLVKLTTGFPSVLMTAQALEKLNYRAW